MALAALVVDTTDLKVFSPGDLGIGRLFEHIRDAVVVADAASGHIVLWNPAAEKLFGYTPEEAVGMPVEALVPAELKPQHRAGLARYLATGHGAIIDAGAVVEVPAAHKGGREITVELTLNPIEEPSVSSPLVLAVIRDVSDRALLRAEANQRLRELEALYAADETLHRSLRLEDVLQALVDLTHEILEADTTTVLVWDAHHTHLIPGATRGMHPETVARISHALGEGIAGLVPVTRRPIAVERVANDPRVSHHLTDPEGVCSLLQVPIHVEGDVFGVFGVSYRHERTFTGAEERLLVALAARAAVAISNARQYQQAQDIAMIEERQRVARDLHDAVAQTLFAAGLNAQALPHVWAADPEEGQRCVAELQRLTWGALAEMRTVLVELHPAGIWKTDLGDLLRQLAQAMAGRAPLLEIAVNSEGERKLPPAVQTVFYRVAQEALTNIVKHANATHVELRLVRTSDAVEISVTDDGHGFDPLEVGGGHLGLGIMRERLESVGGTFSIDSAPDRGTRLRGTWTDATAM